MTKETRIILQSIVFLGALSVILGALWGVYEETQGADIYGVIKAFFGALFGSWCFSVGVKLGKHD